TLLPEESAIRAVTVKALRAERGDDMGAVGRWRRVGVARLRVALDPGHALAGDPVPDDLAAALVEGVDPPGVFRRLLDRADVAVVGRSQYGLAVGADGRRHVDAILPDDGARVSQAGDGCFPANVVVPAGVPGDRWELAV